MDHHRAVPRPGRRPARLRPAVGPLRTQAAAQHRARGDGRRRRRVRRRAVARGARRLPRGCGGSAPPPHGRSRWRWCATRYAGDRMARTMSHIMATFILVPAIAPSVGCGDPRRSRRGGRCSGSRGWRLSGSRCWARRLPETLPPERRRPPVAGRLPGRRGGGRAHAADGRLRHRADVHLRDHDRLHRQLAADHRRGLRPRRTSSRSSSGCWRCSWRRLVHQRPPRRAHRPVRA